MPGQNQAEEQFSPPVFILVKGEAPVEWFLFNGEEMTIGRDPTNDVQIESVTCSRVHAKIFLGNGKTVIEDCNSTNGTYINKKKIKKATPLEHLDRVYIGGTEWLVYIDKESLEPNPFLLIENVQNKLSRKAAIQLEQLQKELREEEKKGPKDFKKIRLRSITSLFTKINDGDELYDALLEVLFREYQFDRGVILLQNKETGELIPKSTRNTYGQKAISRIAICRKALERVLANEENLIILDASQDQRFAGDFAIKVQGVRTIVCIPLRRKDKIYGIVYLDTRKEKDDLKIEEIKEVISICEQASIVSENTSLFQQIGDPDVSISDLETIPLSKFQTRSRFEDYIPFEEVVHNELKTSFVKVETLVEELLEKRFAGTLVLANEKRLCRGFCLFYDGRIVGCYMNGIHFKEPLSGVDAMNTFWDIAHEPDGLMTVKSFKAETVATILPLILDQKIYSSLLSEFIYVDKLLNLFRENKYTGCITGEIHLRRINGIVHIYDGEVLSSIVGGEIFPGESKPFSDVMNNEAALINVYVLESRRFLDEDLLSQLPLSG